MYSFESIIENKMLLPKNKINDETNKKIINK